MLLLAAVVGCGSKQPGRVTGRVLLDGKPLPGGILTFISADLKGLPITATVDESGSFTADLPQGDVLASFDNRQFAPLPSRGPTPIPKGLSAEARAKMGRPPTPAPAPAEPPPPPDRVGRFVRVPERYYMIETANLKLTVSPGEQKHDIELTSK
jgi:hypothetical protein